MAVVTVATHSNPGSRRFIESCTRLGFEPQILEMGSEWRGFGWKFKRVLAALKTVQSEIVLHSDCFDAVCLQNLEMILAKFKELDHPWIFSFEEVPQPEEYLHLNAGMWMANRQYALSTLGDGWMEEFFPDHINDQFQLQAIYSWHPDWFKLDKESRLFYTQNPYAPDLVEKDGELAHPQTGIKPCFVHGPNKADLSNIDKFLASRKVETGAPESNFRY